MKKPPEFAAYLAKEIKKATAEIAEIKAARQQAGADVTGADFVRIRQLQRGLADKRKALALYRKYQGK